METNNNLIAEFLGYIDNGCSEEGFLIDPKTNYDVCIDSLQFHIDWNWLMQVVEKIESLDGHLHICDNDVFVHFPKRIKGCVRINGESLKLSKIEAVYNACVEFVKWYNEQK